MHKIHAGLKANWQQFTLLVIVNGFVGGMVGLERTILPVIAETTFDLTGRTAIASFIIAFGITKALANYVAGRYANRVGRKKLLVAGWLFGLPVPIILMLAPSWSWIIFANVLLGINQGLAWSSTVLMKIDLAGPKDRGLAMGLNESAGYLAVGLVAFLTGYIANQYGPAPYPFFLGTGIALTGLFSSLFLVKDTRHHAVMEAEYGNQKHLKNIFWETTWNHPNLGSITQAGLINNLNDGMIWGLLPVLLTSMGFNLKETGLITGVYPLVWGMGQLGTGKLADLFLKKQLLIAGMLLQGFALVLLALVKDFEWFLSSSILLGIGTAIVYPAFVAAISEETHPEQRPESIGVFRLWRDLGYAIGALLTGIVADRWNVPTAIIMTGLLTLFSALLIGIRMKNQKP